MKDKISLNNMISKYKFIILYGIFGVLTTVINIAAYGVLYEILNISNIVSTIISWIIAVVFAFVTNKIWVFESKCFDNKLLLSELKKFFGCRIATGILDLGIMFIGVDVLGGPALILKTISNLLVIVLNYVMSKFIVFGEKGKI